MKRAIRRHRDVATDVIQIASFIADKSPVSAMRFIDRVEETLGWVLRHPGTGALRRFDAPELARVRAWPVRGFRNHLIYYEITETGIYVLAILHGARDLPRVLGDRG